MKATLMLLGACIVAPLAGGYAGASINTVPLHAVGDPLATIPRHSTDFSGDIADTAGTPDHYPLVTQHGTVPVAELIYHGGLGRRYDPDYAARQAQRSEASLDETGASAPEEWQPAPATSADTTSDDATYPDGAYSDGASRHHRHSRAETAGPDGGLAQLEPAEPVAEAVPVLTAVVQRALPGGALPGGALPGGGAGGALALAQ